MATPLRLWGFLILMSLAMQGACFSGGEYPIFAPGFVVNGREPLRHFCTNSSLRAACEHLEKGRRQEAQQVLRDYLKVHSSDLIAVTAYTQSLTAKELQQLLSHLEGRQQTLSAAERYQLGIAALYLWDRSVPIVPGDPRLPTIDGLASQQSTCVPHTA